MNISIVIAVAGMFLGFAFVGWYFLTFCAWIYKQVTPVSAYKDDATPSMQSSVGGDGISGSNISRSPVAKNGGYASGGHMHIWEGIKYSAKTLGKLRVWGKSTPYFVGDLVRVEVTLERIDNNARKFEDVFITEISPRDSEVRKDLSEKDFSSFNRLGDKKVIFVIEKRARASGEMQFYLGRGRIDEHKISKVLFSADIENDDQYILKFVFPFVSAIVGFFIAIVLPIVWKYVLIAWEWFWQYIKNA